MIKSNGPLVSKKGEGKWIQLPLPMPGENGDSDLKIFIADSHLMVREGIKRILDCTAGLEVVGEAGNGPDVLDRLETSDCDIVLLNQSLSEGKGLHYLQELKKIRPDLPVLVLSIYPEQYHAARAIRAGADGYLTKEKTTDELLKAIQTVSGGKTYISLSLAEKLTFDTGSSIKNPVHETLSNREFQVMCLIASGKTIKEMAGKLLLNTHTISTYRSRLLKKMGMTKNAEVIYYALKEGLIA